MQAIKNLGIKEKFQLILGISFFMVGLFISLYFPLVQKNEMIDSLQVKAKVMAQMIGKASGVALIFEDPSSVITLLDAVKQMPDVLFASVIAKDGNNFASYNEKQSEDYANVVRSMIRQKQFHLDDERLMIYVYPVISEKYILGYVVLGMSKQQIDSAVASSRIRTSIISVLIFIIGLVSMRSFFSFVIYKPIRNLTSIADKLSLGDLNVNIDVRIEDEIGQLERSFISIINSTKETSAIAELIAKGELSRTAIIRSENDILAISMNKVIETLNSLIWEVTSLTQAASEGNLSQRGNISNFNGGYRSIIQGINDTLEAVIIPINEGVETLGKIAEGDLTCRFVGDCKGDHLKIKNSVNLVAVSLHRLLAEVNDAISATTAAAEEISSSTEQMAAGSQEQSQNSVNIAVSIEQMAKAIHQNAEQALLASENSNEASKNALAGSQKVEQARQGMMKIVKSSKDTSEKISALSGKTEQISEIIEVIDDIAVQTNLLALNASIEAAHAGDKGRGFAVVADEVRKLAESTTKATQEISEKIESIQKEARDVTQAMVNAEHSIEEGVSMTVEVASALASILQTSELVRGMIAHVAEGNQQQSENTEVINKNIEGISIIIQQFATSTVQLSRSTDDLNRLTVKLRELISGFRLEPNLLVEG